MFVYPSFDGYLSCFYFGVVTDVAVNIIVHTFVHTYFFKLL